MFKPGQTMMSDRIEFFRWRFGVIRTDTVEIPVPGTDRSSKYLGVVYRVLYRTSSMNYVKELLWSTQNNSYKIHGQWRDLENI